MKIRPLEISGAWLLSSQTFDDSRGSFREWFNSIDIQSSVNYKFETQQANLSTSSKGVVRGIHYSLSHKGQAKLITCVSGKIRDVIVDIRYGSPTYGEWIHVDVSALDGKSLLVDSGLGHGFSVLEENTCVTYLLSSTYSPKEELVISPLDKALNIDWNIKSDSIILSKKDAEAPELLTRQINKQLPIYNNM